MRWVFLSKFRRQERSPEFARRDTIVCETRDNTATFIGFDLDDQRKMMAVFPNPSVPVPSNNERTVFVYATRQ